MAAPSRQVLSEVQMQLDLVTSQCGSVMQQLDLLKDRVIRNNAADEVKKDETNLQLAQDAAKAIPVDRSPPAPAQQQGPPIKPKSPTADRLLSSSDDDDDSFSETSLGGVGGEKKKDIIQLMYERLRMMDESGFQSAAATGVGSPALSRFEETDREEFHDLSPSSNDELETKAEENDLEQIFSSMNFIRGSTDDLTPGRKEKRTKKEDSSKKNVLKKKVRTKKVKINSNSNNNPNVKEKKSKNKISPYEVPLSKVPQIVARQSEILVKQRSNLQCSVDKKISGFQKKLIPKKKTEVLLKKSDQTTFNEPLKRVKKLAETLKKSISRTKPKPDENKPIKSVVSVKFDVADTSVLKNVKKDQNKPVLKPVKTEENPLPVQMKKPVVSIKQSAPKSKQTIEPPPTHIRANPTKETKPPLKPVEPGPMRPIPSGRRTSVKIEPKTDDGRAVTRQTSYTPAAVNKSCAQLDDYAPSRDTFTVGADCRIRRSKSFVARHDLVSPNLAIPAISFNAIPFIVGQSTSKSYHIGLNIQQTLSLLKITPSLTGIPVLNDKTGKDGISTATSIYSSRRTSSPEENTCPACTPTDKDISSFYEGDDLESRDPWAVPLREPWEMPNRLPSKCTCLPKPVVSIHHVLSQLLQNDKMTASHHAMNGFQNVQDEKCFDEDDKLKQSVRKYTGSNTLYFAKLLKTMQGFRERVIKSEM